MPDDRRPIAEIVAAAGTSRMSPKTRYSHAHAVNTWLGWCSDQGYQTAAHFNGILKRFLVKPKSRAVERTFTDDDLRSIFECPEYQKGLFKRPIDYWVPLIGLFTGAREAELCQLHHEDIYFDNALGFWVVDFNEKYDKQLKTDASTRITPLHPQLLELGLEQFLKDARQRNAIRIFSEEPRNPRQEFGAFSKRFNRFLGEAVGVKKRYDPNQNMTKIMKDFHSFRHTLIGKLMSKGVEEYVVNTIVGHSQADRSQSVTTYGGSGVSLETKTKLLLDIDWPIDFSIIKPNGWKMPAKAE